MDTIEGNENVRNGLPSTRPASVPDSLPPSKKAKKNSGSMDSGSAASAGFPRSIGISVEHIAPSDQVKDSSATSKPKKTSCQHDVSLPVSHTSEYNFASLKYPSSPAKEYEFPLDAFQRESIKCVHNHESVLVAAHTSAGKTVIAEYAIALALKNNQRVIYTSPIKALSNQKYRELHAEFKDVGLMTGDNTIDKNASCLVMTTEILRSMLYRGSEVVREVAWVIFDEVHYMRDKDRGVVWEEAIILVPESVRFVFLSATIPNAREFSEWIAHLKHAPCHTIYTSTRPVPLRHYIYPVGGGAGIHLVVDEKSNFLPNNFEKAMAEIMAAPANKPGAGGAANRKKVRGQGNNTTRGDCYKVVEMIQQRNYHPVIVFSFSRRDCENFAMQLSKLDFNTDEERETVNLIFESAVMSLNEEDRNLPQITAILPLLLRGVGIHHSGLLPIIKEVVEILFQEGLIKCLLATETFAMGVNMPARTVLFTQVRKFDGEKYRVLSGGEYVQMSGRAGRRGVDDQGVAILMSDEKLEPGTAKLLMSGTAEPLTSTFRLGYNMLLNLMRAEDAEPEYVIGRSFAQFQGDRSVPKLEAALKSLEEERDVIRLGGPELGVEDHEVKSYFKLKEVAEKLKQEIRDVVHQPGPINAFLQQGRLVRVTKRIRNIAYDYGWGAIVDYRKPTKGAPHTSESNTIKVLLRCLQGTGKHENFPLPFSIQKSTNSSEGSETQQSQKSSDGDREEWMVVSCSLADLQGLSAIRVVKPKDLEKFECRATFGRYIVEVLERFPDGPPMLDPLTDIGIKNKNLVILLRKSEAVEEAMLPSSVAKCGHIRVLSQQWKKRQEADDRVKQKKRAVKEAKGLILQEELKKMKRVLKRLGFVNPDGVVEVKGRLACEINTADELVITELLLGGNMNELSAEILVSLCSCFVIDEGRKEDGVKLERELQSAYDTLVNVAQRVITVKKEAGLPISVDDPIDLFRPHAMTVVYHWMKGRRFEEVCQLTDLFEGSVIRCFRRLEELLRQLITAVKAIGNTELAEKFENGSQVLKRGIAFQSSLYV